jgi:hypothetical protein
MIGLDDVIKPGNINSLLRICNVARLRAKLYDLRDDSKFAFGTCHLYAATFQQYLRMEYISLSVDPIFQSLCYLSGCP